MDEWIQNNRLYSLREQLSKSREWGAELSYAQVLSKSRGYDLVDRVRTLVMRKQPQSHWDKLPNEIKDKIFSYLKVVHLPTNKRLFDLSHSNALMTEQIFFIQAHRGEFNLDILNAMRVNTKWYFGITSKHRKGSGQLQGRMGHIQGIGEFDAAAAENRVEKPRDWCDESGD